MPGDSTLDLNLNLPQWERIGEVVGGPGGGGGDTMGVGAKMHGGVSYDWVFDVDVEDGAPPRKLPYNRGDNPYDVADRWLAEQARAPKNLNKTRRHAPPRPPAARPLTGRLTAAAGASGLVPGADGLLHPEQHGRRRRDGQPDALQL